MAQQKTEKTVEDKLLALHNLQEVVTKIDQIRTQRGELPLEVQDLEDDIAGLATRIEKYDKEVALLEARIKEFKHQIEENAAVIAKYKEQQNNVSNNREFDYLSKEIEYKELEVQFAEKKIKEATADIAHKQEEVAAAKATFDDKQEVLNQKKAELEAIISETKAEEEKLMGEAQEIEGTIDDDRLLNAFKRIRSNARNGLAVVAIDRDACGGCFSRIPAQRQLDIRSRKKIIVCEFCGRILVDPDLGKSEAEIEAEKAAEKPAKKTARKKAAKKDEE